MPIELKGLNYYSKVLKRINYRLSNSTFWVVINADVSNFPDISNHLVVDLFFPQKWQKNEHVGPSPQNKSTSHNADDEVSDISKQIVVNISSPQGQHIDNKGTHMITISKLKNDSSLKSQMLLLLPKEVILVSQKHIVQHWKFLIGSK